MCYIDNVSLSDIVNSNCVSQRKYFVKCFSHGSESNVLSISQSALHTPDCLMEGLKGRGRKIIGLGKLHYCICIRSSADSCTWYSFIMIKIRWRHESSPICKKKRSCMWRKGIKWWLYYQQTRKNPINMRHLHTETHYVFYF